MIKKNKFIYFQRNFKKKLRKKSIQIFLDGSLEVYFNSRLLKKQYNKLFLYKK